MYTAMRACTLALAVVIMLIFLSIQVVLAESSAAFYPEAHPEAYSFDGFIRNDGESGGGDWDVVHDAVTLSEQPGSLVSDSDAYIQVRSENNPNHHRTQIRVSRGIFSFDTSAISEDTTIYSARLSLYPIDVHDLDDDEYAFLSVVRATSESDVGIRKEDFDQVGVTHDPLELHDERQRKDISEVHGGERVVFELNQNGIQNITKEGVSKFGLREGHDILDIPVDETPDGFSGAVFASAETEGIEKDPMLIIELEDDSSECCSSVLFIPGIKATELYENEKKVWLPGVFGVDANKLTMTEDGESIKDIRVGEALSSAYGVVDVYQSFFDYLETLKEGEVIREWDAAAYDWRYDPRDIVSRPQQLADGSQKSLVSHVTELASESKNGKVTIVAHSNGGLVAKALVDEVEGGEDIIDRLVLVGVPQRGTPSAIASMLHGNNQSLPGPRYPTLMLSKSNARELSKNMPGAYGLLPTSTYVEQSSKPLITFREDSMYTELFREQYGESIDTYNKLSSFLSGEEGREEMPSVRVAHPLVLLPALLQRAEETHEVIFDVVPSIPITEIVGWGKLTVDGVYYDEFCGRGFGCGLYPRPLFTHEGDETVTALSAGAIEGAERYFLDLYEGYRWNHTTMLSASPLHELFTEILNDTSSVVPSQYVSTERPERIRADWSLVSVHSPVSVTAVDEQNRETGLVYGSDSDLIYVNEQIPRSFYREFGEGKYIGLYDESNYELQLRGTDSGFFTLEVDRYEGDERKERKTFSDIPVTSSLVGYASVIEGHVEEVSIDTDGNGEVDKIVLSNDASIPELVDRLLQQMTVYDVDHATYQRIEKKINFVLLEYKSIPNKENVMESIQHDISVLRIRDTVSVDQQKVLQNLVEQISVRVWEEEGVL